MKLIKILLFMAVALMAGNAFALETAIGKVVGMETTYMPTRIKFSLTAGTPSCPAGSSLNWQKTADTNKATYAALLTALAADKNITIFVNNGDTACAVQFLYINR